MSEPARSRRFESEAADKLLAAVDTEPAEAAWAACNAAAISVAFGDADLVRRMQDVARLIMAAEALADAAKAIATNGRAALAEAMMDVGCPTLALEFHSVSASAGRPRAIVPDEQAVPRRFWVQPPERIDTKALLKALKAGDEDARAAASLSNGAPFVTFHAKESAA